MTSREHVEQVADHLGGVKVDKGTPYHLAVVLVELMKTIESLPYVSRPVEVDDDGGKVNIGLIVESLDDMKRELARLTALHLVDEHGNHVEAPTKPSRIRDMPSGRVKLCGIMPKAGGRIELVQDDGHTTPKEGGKEVTQMHDMSDTRVDTLTRPTADGKSEEAVACPCLVCKATETTIVATIPGRRAVRCGTCGAQGPDVDFEERDEVTGTAANRAWNRMCRPDHVIVNWIPDGAGS